MSEQLTDFARASRCLSTSDAIFRVIVKDIRLTPKEALAVLAWTAARVIRLTVRPENRERVLTDFTSSMVEHLED